MLLILHSKLHRWLQPGGHCDPTDADIVSAAVREVQEETGLTHIEVAPGFPDFLDVDIHTIPANPRKGEPEHAHFDVRVLLRAKSIELHAGSDAVDARWVPLDQMGDIETDESVRRAVRKLLVRPG